MLKVLKHLVLAWGLLALGNAKAQDTTKRPAAQSAVVKRDSVRPERRRSDIYRETFKRVHRKFDSTLFTTGDNPTTSWTGRIPRLSS